jgi:ABC-type dipeptide/oligopeptide/nickel transport system permease component
MTRYILGRVLSSALVLVLLSVIVFAMVRLIPGDPVAAFADPANPDPVELDRLRAELGLDRGSPSTSSGSAGCCRATSAARSRSRSTWPR